MITLKMALHFETKDIKFKHDVCVASGILQPLISSKALSMATEQNNVLSTNYKENTSYKQFARKAPSFRLR